MHRVTIPPDRPVLTISDILERESPPTVLLRNQPDVIETKRRRVTNKELKLIAQQFGLT
jgi:hypothetical protein